MEVAQPSIHVEPPQDGELSFTLALGPASVQGGKVKKDALLEEVLRQTRDFQYLLTGDMALDIEWMIHEHERYETDRSPDIDNIWKPLIDSFCGPQGVLIDDCQVQSVAMRWIDWTFDRQEINVRMKFHSDEWMRKAGLYFVHHRRALCFPVGGGLKPELEARVVEHLRGMIESRDRLMATGVDYYAAKSVMSVQRPFHRSRLQRFEVRDADAVLSALKNA
jgi:Holliday junction resolvase RusA-like endonuclease